MQNNSPFEKNFPDSFEETEGKRVLSGDEIAFRAQESIRRKEFYMDSRKGQKKSKLSRKADDLFFRLRKWWKCLKKYQKILYTLVAVLILVFVSATVWFFSNFTYRYKSISSSKEDLGIEKTINKNVMNIAVFGRDSINRKDNPDSLIVLSINKKTKSIKAVSVLGNTLVPIETDDGIKYGKLNDAYALGGPQLAVKTVNQNFSLDISEFLTLNYYGLADIIDSLGGIEAPLTSDEVFPTAKDGKGINDLINEICEYKKLNPENYYVTMSGKQRLNGIQAVAYSCVKECKSDWDTDKEYGRANRKIYVIEQLFIKAKGLDKKQRRNLTESLVPHIETSFSYSDIIKFPKDILFEESGFAGCTIPQNGKDTNFLMKAPKGDFGSVEYYDLEYSAKVIKAFIYKNMSVEKYVKKYGIKKNDWYSGTDKSSAVSAYEEEKPQSSEKEITEEKDTSSLKTSKPDKPYVSSKPAENTPSENKDINNTASYEEKPEETDTPSETSKAEETTEETSSDSSSDFSVSEGTTSEE